MIEYTNNKECLAGQDEILMTSEDIVFKYRLGSAFDMVELQDKYTHVLYEGCLGQLKVILGINENSLNDELYFEKNILAGYREILENNEYRIVLDLFGKSYAIREFTSDGKEKFTKIVSK